MRLRNLIPLLWLGACATMAQPPARVLDRNRIPISLTQMVKTPVIYEAWWREIAMCEKLPLPPEHLSITWVIVPARPFIFEDSTLVMGWLDAATIMPVLTIYINQFQLGDELLIKHEMVHALLFWAYRGKYNHGTLEQTHPKPWYGKCMMEMIQ